jgi:hypothetical protein
MSVIESAKYKNARAWIKRNAVISMMAVGVATVPLAEIAREDGTPRFEFLLRANRAFDEAQARNAGNPCYEPYPADSPTSSGSFWVIAQGIEATSTAVAPSGWFTGPHRSGEMWLLPERAASRRLRRPPGPSARVDHGLCGPWCHRVGTTAASPGFPAFPGVRSACGLSAPLPARAAVGILTGKRNNVPPMYLQRIGQR